jgi:ABC-type glycerol-3-phosphate transport system permease component
MTEPRFQKRTLFLFAYLIFALLPIYWMVNMSFKTNDEILSSFSLWPTHFTWANYATIFTDESWYSGYINSMIYVAINSVISITVALPAAYAFSRYSFLGDKHVFFWLLTNRMTPPAVFLPLIKAGVGVVAFFCFMFSWVELLLARTLTSVNAKPIVATMTRTVSASGMDWATLAAAGVLTIVPGAIVIWFVRHYIAKGFAMGRV